MNVEMIHISLCSFISWYMLVLNLEGQDLRRSLVHNLLFL